MRNALRRGGLMAAVVAALLLVVAAAAGAAVPKETTEWLASELQPSGKGEFCESFSASGRVGQTVDCMLAFKAADEKEGTTTFAADRQAAYEYVLANMSAYVGTEPCATASSMSAGAVAKLALGVIAQGGDPMNVEGRNLIADLQCLQATTGPEKGRFKDKGASDFSNVFGQSLAIVALKACAEKHGCVNPPSLTATLTSAATYLRGQQCDENAAEEGVAGAYRSSMGTTLTPTGCNARTPFPSETEFNENAVEVDSTGFAIEALISQGSGASILAAIEAGSWLTSEAKAEGSPTRLHWENYCSFEEATKKLPSVNSTALAIMGYSEIGLSITPAVAWLEAAALSGSNRGLPACGASGNGDVLATAQGILGLYETSYPTLVGI